MNAPAAGSGPRGFRTFEDLEVYRAARVFRQTMDEMAGPLPDSEKRGLAVRIRRAAVLLTNNLAEGHGRFHFPDRIKVTLIARGTLEELMNDLHVCPDKEHLVAERVSKLKSNARRIRRLLIGGQRHVRDDWAAGSRRLHERSSPWPAGEAEEAMPWLEACLDRDATLFAAPGH